MAEVKKQPKSAFSFQDFLKSGSGRRSRQEKEAARLAQDDVLHLIGFMIGEEVYGIELTRLQEILKVTYIAQVPKTPPYMLGVINLRGNIVAAVDLKQKFNLGVSVLGKETRIMVIQFGRRHLGLVVDRVVDVIALPKSKVEPPPPVVGGIGREFLKGVGKIGNRIVVLPNIEKLMASL